MDYFDILISILGSAIRLSIPLLFTALAGLFSEAVSSQAVATLADAVTAARELAPRGSTVLLSPGTSSFDQFSGYEQRGNAFRDLVHQLH